MSVSKFSFKRLATIALRLASKEGLRRGCVGALTGVTDHKKRHAATCCSHLFVVVVGVAMRTDIAIGINLCLLYDLKPDMGRR